MIYDADFENFETLKYLFPERTPIAEPDLRRVYLTLNLQVFLRL